MAVNMALPNRQLLHWAAETMEHDALPHLQISGPLREPSSGPVHRLGSRAAATLPHPPSKAHSPSTPHSRHQAAWQRAGSTWRVSGLLRQVREQRLQLGGHGLGHTVDLGSHLLLAPQVHERLQQGQHRGSLAPLLQQAYELLQQALQHAAGGSCLELGGS